MAMKTFILWLICVIVFIGIGYYVLESPEVGFSSPEHVGFSYFRVANHELRMDGLFTTSLQNGGSTIFITNVEVSEDEGWREVEWVIPGSRTHKFEPYKDLQMVIKTGIRGKYRDPYNFKVRITYTTQIEHFDISRFTGKLAPLTG
jgi:hypothetical protein